MKITITRKNNIVSISVIGPVRKMSGEGCGFKITINPLMPNLLLKNMIFAGNVGNNDTIFFRDAIEASGYLKAIRAAVAEFRRIS